MELHPSRLRAASSRRIFRVLRARGPCSRAELARRTRLSPVTSGKIVDLLLARGLAEEVASEGPAAGAGAMGRPPRLVRLARRRVLPAVELGVRRCRVVGLGLDGSERGTAVSFATPRSLAAFRRRLGAAARGLRRDPSGLVALSVPGVLDPAAGRILYSPNLHWTEGDELIPAAAAPWRGRAHAVQEIQALALGHEAVGEAPDSFVLVDFGDGVGGAVVTGGELMSSPRALCGELGHTGVQGNRRRCACGSSGCLETLVSRRGLLATWRAARRRPRASWGELRRQVVAAGVESWLRPSLDAASLVIAGALNLLGVEHVVLTGELPSLHPEVGEAIAAGVARHALLGRYGRLSCTTAPRRRGLGLVAALEDALLQGESPA